MVLEMAHEHTYILKSILNPPLVFPADALT